MRPKKTVLPREVLKALAPSFTEKFLGREFTLGVDEGGLLFAQPAVNWPALRAELVKAGSFSLASDFPDKTHAEALLHFAVRNEWPDGYAEAERLVELEHSNVISGVEIFATGTHNGDEYTEQDLDDMVSAYKALDFKPALKVGHTKDKVGGPAYGWIENLRKVGKKLVADFSSMHDSVVQAIRERRYDRVSSEIYFNFKRGEKTFRRALKAVALLGAEVPAVAGLKPLHTIQFSDDALEVKYATEASLGVDEKALAGAFEARLAGLENLTKEFNMRNAAALKALKEQQAKFEADLAKLKGKEETAEFKALSAQAEEMKAAIAALEKDDKTEQENKELRERLATLETDRRETRVKERVAVLTVPAFAPAFAALYAHALLNESVKVAVYSKKDGKDVKEEKALSEVLDGLVADINAKATKIFSVENPRSGRLSLPDAPVDQDPGAELDRLTKEHLAKHPDLKGDYAAAFEAVSTLNPALAKAYAESQNPRGN